VRTHAALLRGINVGGHNKLPMADLRAIVAGLGFSDVATYIQSGNVVFGCTDTDTDTDTDTASLAGALERAIAAASAVRPAVVVVSREELRSVVADNPYPEETDPKRLHVVFHREPIPAATVAAVREAEQLARTKGSRDEATVIGSSLYLHTPDGLGRSVLADLLARPAVSRDVVTTTRNWATVQRLVALLDE
jgi:uncharacterized protein (DUF1697 family)